VELLSVVIYFLLISGTGLLIVRLFDLDSKYVFVASFIVGSLLVGVCLFFLAVLHKINFLFMLFVLLVMGLITVFQIKPLVISIRSFFLPITEYLLSNKKYVIPFFACLLVIVLWYVLLTWTPPRSGDAMRYHLAQIKDIIYNQGLEFRPYIHYNFPYYYGILFLPVYYFLDGSVMNFSHAGYFFLSVILTLCLALHLRVKHAKLLVFLFLLIPVSYDKAHVFRNDWTLVFYILAGVLFFAEKTVKSKFLPINIYFAFLALGFALGVKYHAVLFVPWFLVLGWDRLSNRNPVNRLLHLFGVLSVMGLAASPWYIRNLINTGNPCWPLLVDFFAGTHDHFYLVAKGFTNVFTGSYSFSGILDNLKGFLFYPLIPATVWILAGGGLILNRRNKFFLKTGIILFFIVWYILQPKLYLRFSLYILPFALIIAVSLYERLDGFKNKIAKYIYILLVGVTLLYGIILGGFYSKDYMQYHLNPDLHEYHKYTAYYEEYDWINKNLPKDAKLLAIIRAGQTYYLDRKYLRADTFLSALIDWNSIETVDQLYDKLSQLGIDYVLYDEGRNWCDSPGGANMMKLIQQLQCLDRTNILWERDVTLYYSRIRRAYRQTKVILMKI